MNAVKKRRSAAAAAIVAVSDSPESEARRSRDAKFEQMRKVAGEFTGFKQAMEALPAVRAVPTIFPQLDLATRVGGLPIERLTLIHGESAGGKSSLTLGLIKSFIRHDHFADLVDAERTTPNAWIQAEYGELAAHPFFFADRPSTLEGVKKRVRTFAKTVAAQRKKGSVPADTTGIVVIDSIRKLVPKDLYDLMMKEVGAVKRAADEGKEADLDKARSRIHQLKAQMNAVWLDELIPLLEETQTCMVAIAREIVDPSNTNPKAIASGTNVKRTGGSAWFYDASLDLRCTKGPFYGKEVSGKFVPHGIRYRVEIHKTKVSGQSEDFRAQFAFHVSNGVAAPKGFDHARDLLDLARRLDVVEGTGWLKYRNKRWQGEERALAGIRADAALAAEIEAAARACFKLEKTR